MRTQFSKNVARLHIVIIGLFHLVSGIWEFLGGLLEYQYIPSGVHFLLDVYRSYVGYLGLITFLVGVIFLVGALLRLNFARLAVLALAWWNLFTVPLITIWFDIYSALIIKSGVITSLLGYILFEILIITGCILVRFYIINMLKISKAGYVFLKK